jgi:hypothetical protein
MIPKFCERIATITNANFRFKRTGKRDDIFLATQFGNTVDILITHNVIMHNSHNAWDLHSNHGGTQADGVHNA